MSIITISHEAFGDGRTVADQVAATLGYRCISREVLLEASKRYGIAEATFFEVLDTAARVKFEITQKDQAKIFSDLVKSFTQTWGKAHDPGFEKEKRERTRIVLKGVLVA